MRLALVVTLAMFMLGCTSEPRGACNPNPPPGAVGSICGFANPEDVEAVRSAGLLLVSQMRRGSSGGSIAAIRLDAAPETMIIPRRMWPSGDAGRDLGDAAPAGDPACTVPPPAEAFAPHGLTSAPGDSPGVVRVAVVAHHVREAIELFDLSGVGENATLSWRGCVPLPPHVVGNDVAFAPDGELIVSNYMPAMEGWRGLYYTLKSGVGMNTGDVLAWRRERGWRHLPASEAPSPNGVLVAADGASVFYAETGSGKISRIPRVGVTPQRPQQVSIGGNPDNLSLSPRGTILAATHTDGAAFLLCAFGRTPCRTGWSIYEIDPASLHATLLLHHDGNAVGGVASAAEFDGRLYFGAVFDDRIGVWRR